MRLPSQDSKPSPTGEPDPTEYALVSAIDNPDEFGKLLDTLASRANQYLAELENEDGAGPKANKAIDLPVLALEKLKAPERGYQLTSPARLVPWLVDDLKPTILFGKSHVAVAASLELAREALSAELPAAPRWSPQGELLRALECLPENLTFLSVGDDRDSPWPTLFEGLPSKVQLLAGLVGGFDADQAPTGSELLAFLGVPLPGGFRVRIDPKLIPTADQIRKHLFPSVLAATTDDRGFRLIAREAFPLACVGTRSRVKYEASWSSKKGLDRDIKLKFDLGLKH